MYTPLRFNDWMAKYRPTGVGIMTIETWDPAGTDKAPVMDKQIIKVTDVICDLCNSEIKPTDAQGRQTIIWSQEGYSVCSKCPGDVVRGPGRTADSLLEAARFDAWPSAGAMVDYGITKENYTVIRAVIKASAIDGDTLHRIVGNGPALSQLFQIPISTLWDNMPPEEDE